MKTTKSSAIVAFLLGLVPLGPVAASGGAVRWRTIGPGAGGAMFGVAFCPADPNLIIFGGDMGAMYRTEDGGRHWTITGGPSGHQPGTNGVWDVRFDRKHPNIVWAVGAGAYQSVDSGKTWRRRTPFGYTIGAVGLDPSDETVVYIAEGMVPRLALGWVRGRVWKTTDGGKTWRELRRPHGPIEQDDIKNRNYTRIIVDPFSRAIPGEGHARVYLAGRGGLYRSDDAGKNWSDLSAAFAPGQVSDLALVPVEGRPALFVSVIPAKGLAKGGVYKSTDNGETWTPCNDGLDTIIDRLHKLNKTLAENPTTPLFSLMLGHSPQSPRRLYVGSYMGIARSDDLGQHWRMIVPSGGTAVKDRNGRYVAVLKDTNVFQKSLWGGIDHFQRLAVCAASADILAFTDNQGLYRSLAGGRTWNDICIDYGSEFDPDVLSVPASQLPPNRYTNSVRSRGVQNIVCDQIAVDPFDRKTIYAAYMDLGLEITRDDGIYWEHRTKGTPSRGHAWAVEVDPAKEGRVFLSIGQTYGQPGGVYRSDDKGRSWTRIGLADASMGKIADIALDLRSPVNRRTIYLATQKKGVYRSEDGGGTWHNITPNFKEAEADVLTIQIAPSSSDILYAGTGAGLFVSRDRGRSWQRLGTGLFQKVENLSICRSAPEHMYVVAHLPGQNGHWGEAHIWRSDNGGRDFRDITPPFMRFAGAVAVNPFDSDYVYACTFLIELDKPQQKMLIVRSLDGGKTWEDIGHGIAFGRGRHITLDPRNPRRFFVHARFGIIEGLDDGAPMTHRPGPREPGLHE